MCRVRRVLRADHPRSRGVYGDGVVEVHGGSGSSPLARGLRVISPFPCGAAGIIPARAGFTLWSVPVCAVLTDHPRSRGVYPSLLVTTPHVEGSSPLARGLLGDGFYNTGGAGIIPARAGFTTGSTAEVQSRGDHPRSRGVYHRCLLTVHHRAGSSPLARGLRQTHRISHMLFGIIPARAGFTRRLGRHCHRTGDHPRSRGVYGTRTRITLKCMGSSPLARGLRLTSLRRSHHAGIIPARAGFTWASIEEFPWLGDHPRSRGVYGFAYSASGHDGGSSPLARGLPADNAGDALEGRIIPARAGFTERKITSGLGGADHPRSRGVYSHQR